MRKKVHYFSLLPIYLVLIAAILLLAAGGSHAITVLSVNTPVSDRNTVIIDAGHGGVDGGATSCTGILESHLNLEIALKLDDLMHLLGINTVLIRDGDYSVHTKGGSISQKKVSDLKERVRIVNETEHALLISIHQNHFSDSKYYGPQVFYAPTSRSQELASQLQNTLKVLNPTNHRQVKQADGVYLMQHITSPGILVECGFISNPEEEALLRSGEYQNKLCSVIACVCSNFLYQ